MAKREDTRNPPQTQLKNRALYFQRNFASRSVFHRNTRLGSNHLISLAIEMKILLSIAFCISLASSVLAADLGNDWPQWRGPAASGVAASSNPPTTWSESENVKWKVEVPGIGSSTPIILGDRVYVATAVKTDRVKAGAKEGAATEQTGGQRLEGGGGESEGAEALAAPVVCNLAVVVAIGPLVSVASRAGIAVVADEVAWAVGPHRRITMTS